MNGIDGVGENQVATLGFANEQGSSSGSQNLSSIRFKWQKSGTTGDKSLPTLLVLVSLYLHHTNGECEALTLIGEGGNPQAFLTRTAVGVDGEMVIVVETDETREAMYEEQVQDVEEIIKIIEQDNEARVVPFLGGDDGSAANLVDTELRVDDGVVVVYSTKSGKPKKFSNNDQGFINVPISKERGRRKPKWVAAGRVIESFLATFMPDKYGYLSEVHDLATKRGVTLHYDHWFDLSSHECTRGCSPLQNEAFMGSRGPVPRPDPAMCSQFLPWQFKGNWYNNNGDYEKRRLEVDLRSDGRGDAPGVVWMDDELHERVFNVPDQTLENVYPIERYPLIWLPQMRNLLCRHGQIYCPVDMRVDASTMKRGWFRLRILSMSRRGYPRTGCNADKVSQMRDCHNLMGWACFGEAFGRVLDHKCQNNKQDFSEKNLRYVTQSDNMKLHYAYKRDGGDVIEAEEEVVVEEVVVEDNADNGAVSDDAAPPAASPSRRERGGSNPLRARGSERGQRSITEFFKSAKRPRVSE